MADRVVTLRMTEAEYAQLVNLAKDNRRSMNGQLLHLVTAACSHGASTVKQNDSTPPAPRSQPGEQSSVAPFSQPIAPPIVPPRGTKPKNPAPKASTLPAAFEPTPGNHALAVKLGVDIDREVAKFLDHHAAKGSRFVAWDRALNTWLRNAAEFASARGSPGSNGHVTNPDEVSLWR